MDYPYSAPYPAANNAATDRRANIVAPIKPYTALARLAVLLYLYYLRLAALYKT